MKKVFILPLLIVGLLNAKSADKDVAEKAVQKDVAIEKHLHTLDISTTDNNFWEQVKTVIQKALNDDAKGCRGALIKTEKGIIKFKKFPPIPAENKKLLKKLKKLTAEKMAYRELYGGLHEAFCKLGTHLDKHFAPKKMHKKHDKD